MTRSSVCFFATGIACAMAWGQPPPSPDSAGPAAPGTVQVWLEPGPLHETVDGLILVDCAEPEHADKPVVFKCDLHSTHAVDAGTLRIEVKDRGGAVVYQDKKVVNLDKDGGSCQMEWDSRSVAPGVYHALLELRRPTGFTMARREYLVRKVDIEHLRAEFEAVQGRITQVSEQLAALEAQGVKPPYIRMRVAIAQDYLAQAREALDKADWPRVDSVVRYLDHTAEAVPGLLTFGTAAPELWNPVLQPALGSLEVRDGQFRVEGRPVFLLGANLGSNPRPEDMGRLARCGLNFAVFSVGPRQTLASPTQEADFRATLDPVFQQASTHNVALMVSLAPEAMASWMTEQSPELVAGDTEAVDITQAAARTILERHIRTVVPYVASQKMVKGLCLIEKPEFRFSGEEVRLGFLETVRSKYKDRHAVNQAWKGLFADLNEIQIGWNRHNPRYQESPAYRYDWQTHHQQLGSEYISWLRSLTQPLAPHTPITLAFTGRAFEPGDAEFGVDREAVTSLLDVTGCCAANTHIDSYYALGYPQQVLLYTLMRSFAPGKPLANLEDDLVNESPSEDLCTFKYVHSVLWEAAMAGLNASALRVPLDSLRPECLEAYATAALDLNRLAPIIAAFQQAPVEVAILWSMPSKVYANGMQHLESARYAFEGCSFAGYKVEFITEKQCVENHLSDLKVLVVPDTPSVANETFPVLKEFMQGQGMVIRTSSSILFDEHGHSRRDMINNTRRTVLVHGQNLPAEYLHAMDAVATSGELPSIPRTVNQFDYPQEGVKSRYVEVDGQEYLYVINVRKEPVTSHLHGGSRSGHDLIHGRDVSFPMRLTPLVPVLVRLDKQEAPAPAQKKSLFGKKHEGPGKPK